MKASKIKQINEIERVLNFHLPENEDYNRALAHDLYYGISEIKNFDFTGLNQLWSDFRTALFPLIIGSKINNHYSSSEWLQFILVSIVVIATWLWATPKKLVEEL